MKTPAPNILVFVMYTLALVLFLYVVKQTEYDPKNVYARECHAHNGRLDTLEGVCFLPTGETLHHD